MNLNIYDIPIKLDKTKSWINIKTKQLISRTIPFRKYNTVGKKYVKSTSSYEYFIILLDEKPVNNVSTKTKFDDYGRIKILLNSIWNDCDLQYYEK